MEVASPLAFTPVQAGAKRSFPCSPGLVEGAPSSAVGMDISDDYSQQSFKRRRFNDHAEPPNNHSANPFAMMGSHVRSQSPSNGSALKRSRNELHSVNGQDLNVVVEEQKQEIAGLKQDKASLESTVHELRVENERVVSENKILKKAVTIQKERQNHADSEIQAANTYKAEAEERMRKLEQMILTLRYHLQAQGTTPGNDFMGMRPPDVF